MELCIIIGSVLLIVGFLAWAWVNGIDRMMNEHPDYKGEDMLDEEPVFKRDLEIKQQTDEKNI